MDAAFCIYAHNGDVDGDLKVSGSVFVPNSRYICVGNQKYIKTHSTRYSSYSVGAFVGEGATELSRRSFFAEETNCGTGALLRSCSAYCLPN